MSGHATLDSTPSLFTGDDQRPVERVSWDDVKAADGFLDRTGFSLPSEAQWEYAARGGTSTAFSFSDDCNAFGCDACAPADSFMWWCGNSDTGSGRVTHTVGQKQANAFGLFDMHGNIWEWCEDVYDADFYGKPEAAGPNPVATSGSVFRVIRGGSWDDFAQDEQQCRADDRRDQHPSSLVVQSRNGDDRYEGREGDVGQVVAKQDG